MYAIKTRCLARTRGQLHAGKQVNIAFKRSVSSAVCRQHIHSSLHLLNLRSQFPTSSGEAALLGLSSRAVAPASTLTALSPNFPVPSNRRHRSYEPKFTENGMAYRGRPYVVDRERPPQFAPPPNAPAHIAVLGGGLTGLTTAFYLSEFLPSTKITLYEASDRLGGWIETKEVEVQTPDGIKGTVRFEGAARMVKPQTQLSGPPKWDDLIFYELVHALGLADELRHSTSLEVDASGFLYYPDHLVTMPNNLTFKPLSQPLKTIRSLVTFARLLLEPAFRGIIPSFFNLLKSNKEVVTMLEKISSHQADYSIGQFISTRLGRPDQVDRVASAIIHGIMGGDIWKLSLLSGPWQNMVASYRRKGSPDSMSALNTPVHWTDYRLMDVLCRNQGIWDLANKYLHASGIWFRNGFQTFTDALAVDLSSKPNVTIKLGEPVESVRYDEASDRVLITTETEKQPVAYDKVVSTLYAQTLANITNGQLPALENIPAVTIQLVNLWYPQPLLNHPYHGFGYLLPQALGFDRNPECLLGVIFDSDREFPIRNPDGSPVDPSNPPNRGADTVPGTKLTVMLGGHYWDDLPDEFLPDSETAIELAKQAVERHLNLDPSISAQAVARAKLCRQCIPQMLVGHVNHLYAARDQLERNFHGRLAVAGQSYTLPGVLHCLRAARDMAMQIVHKAAGIPTEDDWPGVWVGDTGLDRLTTPLLHQPMEIIPKPILPLRYNSGATMGKDLYQHVDALGRVWTWKNKVNNTAFEDGKDE